MGQTPGRSVDDRSQRILQLQFRSIIIHIILRKIILEDPSGPESIS